MEDDRKRKKNEFRLRIYQHAVQLVRFCSKLPNSSVLREIKGQLVRSGTSIGANFFESEAGASIKDFQNFFSYALKSANETKFWLSILRDSNLLDEKFMLSCDSLFKETEEISKILAKSIITMKNNYRK